MKISHHWLQKYFDADLPEASVLADALTFHAFEIEDVEKNGNDDVLDVKITANRGHDCLSHRGIAKELSAILNLPLASDPLGGTPDLSPKTDAVSVDITDANLCKRYIAGYIRGVKVGPSPKWLQERLEAIGQKSINNVVDATNFVMFNVGQPLHAFDAGKLTTNNSQLTTSPKYKIQVRNAKVGEKMMALDGKEYELSVSNLLIVDGNNDQAIGIAGVKGGMPASITEDTTDIVIESANFDGISVRKTAATLRLRTDASARFEQVISPELAAYGMQGVVELIQKLAGGEVAGFVDMYPSPVEQKPVSVTLEKINSTLGVTLTAKEVEDVFKRLRFGYTESGQSPLKTAADIFVAGVVGAEPLEPKSSGEFTIVPPFERLDIEIPEDLVEEVGRIIGYDHVPATPLPAWDQRPMINKNFYWSERVREFLVDRGFSEIYTSVFAEEGSRIVFNKVDGVRPYLRESLVPAMVEALERNKRNAEMLGLSDVRLFEIGTVFTASGENLMLAIGVKGTKKSPKPEEIVKEMLKSLVAESEKGPTLESPELRSDLASGVCEINFSVLIAQLPEPTEYENLPLSVAERYQPFSKYPFIIRDVAFWAPQDTDAEAVRKNIEEVAGALCTKVFLFDRFEKDPCVSLAFRLVFQSFDRTLTEAEVEPNMEAVYAMLKDKGFEIR